MQVPFAAALKTDRVPPGLDAERFAVYRNNRIVSLIDSLAATFPATQRIVGEEFFRAMARAFANSHPPSSAVLHEYGGRFPDFISAFEPAGELPYLAHVARIEWLWMCAYHAADMDGIACEDLARLGGDGASGARFALHPSLSVLRSAHPAATIWEMNTSGEPGPVADWRGEDVLVARTGMTVNVNRLPGGAAPFVQALMRGETLDTANQIAGAETAGFDPAATLGFLIANGLIVSMEPAT